MYLGLDLRKFGPRGRKEKMWAEYLSGFSAKDREGEILGLILKEGEALGLKGGKGRKIGPWMTEGMIHGLILKKNFG